MIIDPISDMLVSIRNGLKARLVQVAVPASNIKAEIAKVMKSAGYIQDFFITSDFHMSCPLPVRSGWHGSRCRLHVEGRDERQGGKGGEARWRTDLHRLVRS